MMYLLAEGDGGLSLSDFLGDTAVFFGGFDVVVDAFSVLFEGPKRSSLLPLVTPTALH